MGYTTSKPQSSNVGRKVEGICQIRKIEKLTKEGTDQIGVVRVVM